MMRNFPPQNYFDKYMNLSISIQLNSHHQKTKSGLSRMNEYYMNCMTGNIDFQKCQTAHLESIFNISNPSGTTLPEITKTYDEEKFDILQARNDTQIKRPAKLRQLKMISNVYTKVKFKYCSSRRTSLFIKTMQAV